MDIRHTRRSQWKRSDVSAQFQQRCLIGFAGGLLGAFAMNTFARAVAAATHGREAAGAAPGDDREGRGVQPPQADGPADDDATIRVAAVAYRAVTHSDPPRASRRGLGSIVHYAFSDTIGVCYAVIAERTPMIRAGFGVLYGTAVWAVADEMMMPALGLSRGPRQLPIGVHIYSLTGHWVYGVTLESVTRAWDPSPERRP